MTPTPTWYDVLGVSRDASGEEIKAAWRQATDRFEPGSGGQFRMFSEAADVLLDPDRRREYDATLAPADPATAVQPVATPPRADEPPPPDWDEPSPPDRDEPSPAAVEPASAPGRLSGIGTVALAILAALTIAVVAGGVVLGVKVHQAAAVLDARTEAPPAAENAVKALFSYDYRDLATDRERAQGYLTNKFARTYLKNFDALEKQKDGTPGLALQTKAVVKASVAGSGIVDAEEGVARVMVFVNVLSTRGTGDPQIFQNRVSVTMQKHGDRWLVDGVSSY